MKKQMNIVKDPKQLGVRIPTAFVEEFDIQKGDKIEWDNKGKKLKGELKKNE